MDTCFVRKCRHWNQFFHMRFKTPWKYRPRLHQVVYRIFQYILFSWEIIDNQSLCCLRGKVIFFCQTGTCQYIFEDVSWARTLVYFVNYSRWIWNKQKLKFRKIPKRLRDENFKIIHVCIMNLMITWHNYYLLMYVGKSVIIHTLVWIYVMAKLQIIFDPGRIMFYIHK